MNALNQQRLEHIERINKVIDFVEHNLNEELPLAHLSKMAFYSPFHFHRIFSAITGETVNAFINRKRIEKIASLILSGTNTPLTELAMTYGFKSASSFSRAFKKFYGLSPSEFKINGQNKFSKISQVDRKIGQAPITFEQYICSINNIKHWIKMNAKIEVKNMPALKLACIKHTGNFNEIGQVYERLFRWAGPKQLLNAPFKTVTVYHDDPKVTEIAKVRQSAGITVENDIKSEGEIIGLDINAGRFAVGRFEIDVTEFEKAWDSMCVWVAESGYKNRDGDFYELYHNDHEQHPERKFILDICIPVA